MSKKLKALLENFGVENIDEVYDALMDDETDNQEVLDSVLSGAQKYARPFIESELSANFSDERKSHKGKYMKEAVLIANKTFGGVLTNSEIEKILKDIQTNLFEKHKKFTQDNTHTVDSYDQFKKIMSTTKGFISAFWCQDPTCEAQIKADTKATTRCLPLDAKKENGVCVHCGKPASHRWLFGQSY